MLRLDDLELVETELVSGDGRELRVRRMRRAGEDGAEAARRLGIVLPPIEGAVPQLGSDAPRVRAAG